MIVRPLLLGTSPSAAVLRYAHAPVMNADFTSAAANLFANVRLPASIVAGVLIPLTFGYSPIETPPEGSVFGRQPTTHAALVKLYRVFAIWPTPLCLLLSYTRVLR